MVRNIWFAFTNFSTSIFACFDIFMGMLIMLENDLYFAVLRLKLLKTVNFLWLLFRCP